MALFGPDPEEIAAEAKAAQEAQIKEAQDLAKFMTTEGQGISEQATIDLSLEDEEDWASGNLEGLYL